METLKLLINRTPSIAIEAFIAFFSPLRGPNVNIEKIYSEKNFSEEEVMVPIKYLKIINEAACYNQGVFTQYWYLASLKHKNIRIELSKKEKNLDTLKHLRSELMKFLNTEFHKASLSNFELIHKYFEGRRKEPPRISIKGYFKTHEESSVITVFRDREVNYEPETPIKNNSGFEYVHEKGKYYLCNNIMKEAINGRYVNPRINTTPIRKKSFERIFSPKSLWKKCWSNLTEDGESDYYSSTLIVPMTFWNNSLGEEFLDELNILPDKKRTIFGFLCIDHADTEYFKEESDVSVMYYFADALSQYLFSRLVYTEISKTQRELDKHISDNNVEIDMSEVDFLRERIASFSRPIKSVSELNESSEKENYTYAVDKYLFKYVTKLHEIKSNKSN